MFSLAPPPHSYIVRLKLNGLAAMTYARPIKEPRTRKDGLLNFVQMIINAAERGDVREAILLAVDLKDTISGDANPFADVTDGLTRDAVVKEVAEMRRTFELERAAAVSDALRKGADSARAEMLRQLQGA